MGNYIDITGNKYGKLTVLGIHSRDNGRIKWCCKCDCGNTTVVSGGNLKNGHTASCGCEKNKPAVNRQDLLGQRFGRLTVVGEGNGRFTSGGAYKATWICKCDCGNETEVDGEKLRRGHTTSCGCRKKEAKGHAFEDLTGKRFARLTVVHFIEQDSRKTRGYNWMCKCDCGKMIKANANNLKTGRQQSCGCLKEEMKPWLGEVTRKYKYSNKRLYAIYKAMIFRCYDERCREWDNYGGRGIDICQEWLNDYDKFAEWSLNNGYNPKAKHGECTIDRIDVNKGYSPDNCRFISNSEQQNNRRDCVFVEYNGERHSIADWSRILKIPYTTLYNNIRRKGKSIKELI